MTTTRLPWHTRLWIAAAIGIAAIAATLALSAATAKAAHPAWLPTSAIIAVTLLIAAWVSVRIIHWRRHLGCDALTGLGNRHRLEETLQRHHDSCHLQQKPLTLVLIDMDHFKQYNDALGHPAGDRALRQVADLVREHARRPGDLAARPGGDRFAMVLPDTSREGAVHLVQTLIGQVRRLPPLDNDGPLRRVSISVGLYTDIPDAAGACGRFSDGANAALHSAKAAGRDGYFAGPMESG